MKLPIPFFLYVVALGLFGWAGWTVYQTLPLWKKDIREGATVKGQNDGRDLIGKGRGQGTVTTSWRYTPEAAPWWASLKDVNLIGKLPPPPPDETKPLVPEVKVVVDARPLSDLIELVSLVYDGQTGGKGGNSHVIVRFKPEANPELPEWYVKENTTPPPSSTAPAARGDVTKPPQNGRPAPQPPPRGTPVPPPNRGTTMPTAGLTNREVLQKVWADDGGDPRRTASLWPMKPASATPGASPAVLGTIRLVGVSSDAQVAYFEREVPAAAADQPPTKRTEELIKTAMNLSQDVLQELRKLQGRSETPVATAPAAPAAVSTGWLDVEQTTLVGKVRHIGRKDEDRFASDAEIYEKLNVDTYVLKNGGRRGLIVRSVDPQLAASFGVAPGEVLLEINGQKTESKAQAESIARNQYKRGVRTFVTKWMSNGQEIERVFQARDKEK